MASARSPGPADLSAQAVIDRLPGLVSNLIRLAPIPFAALVVLISAAPQASANGRVLRFETQQAGPYRVSLGTIPDTPVVGNIHLTVTVRESSTDEYVLDARVAVVGEGPGGDPAGIGPLVADRNLREPTYYEINTSVDELGPWEFTVLVEAAPGVAEATFTLEVVEASPLGGIAILVVLLGLVTVLGLSARAYFRQRKREAPSR